MDIARMNVDIEGPLLELVDDEDLESRVVVIKEGIMSLTSADSGVLLTTILLDKVTSVESTNRVKKPFGFIINSTGFKWTLFAASENERSQWVGAISKYYRATSPKSVHSDKNSRRSSSSSSTLFFPSSRVSAVEAGSVFDLEEEEARPVTKFSSIDDDEAPIDSEGGNNDLISSSLPVMPTSKNPLKQSSGISMAPPPRPTTAVPSGPMLASSLPMNIASKMRQWRPTLRGTEYPVDDDVEDFVQPHEKAAQTYQEYYIHTGLRLETPSSKEKGLKAHF